MKKSGFLLASLAPALLVSCAATGPAPWNPWVRYDTLQDARDAHSYMTVRIGTQKWMAQNLAFGQPGSWCYGNDSAVCEEMGRLYTRNQAEHACPAGWHLPTGPEWDTLFHTVKWAYAMDKLRSRTGWDFQNGFHPLWTLAKWVRPIAGLSSNPQLDLLGQDVYGFRILPSGIRSSPDGIGETALQLVKAQNLAEKQEFALKGSQAYFWSATSYDETLPSIRSMFSGFAVVSRNPAFDDYGFSVRCVEDSRGN